MESRLTPLQHNVPIVNDDGTPTPYFIQLLQQLREEKAVTDQLAEEAVPKTTQIVAGVGIDGGGDLSGDVVLDADVQEILDLVSTTQGTILYRGAALWAALAPGTDGQFLKTQGVGANPVWAAAAGGGGGWTYVKLGADYVNATTVFSLITDGLGNSFSYLPPANSDIEIELHVLAQTVATANLPKLQITVPGAANNTQYGYAAVEVNQSTGTPTFIVDAFGTSGTVWAALAGALPTSGEPWPYRARVKLRAGSSPAPITFEGGAESAAANACTFKAGSTMRYRVLT